MKQIIEKACVIVGGQTALAKAISHISGKDVRQQHVYNWINRGDAVPTELMAAIEEATSKGVTRKDFCPENWRVIWPELAGECVDHNRRSTDKPSP